MNIFEHLEQAEEVFKRVDESGIRNITKMAKQFSKAQGYFHMDTDGVTSAIGMKAYLERYGIKTTNVRHIQYGAQEFMMEKPKDGQLQWMVDFAHGKPWLNVWTDHHDGQAGVVKTTSTAFETAPSNATSISAKISPSELFPPEDLKVISMVDSADFAKNNITPDDVMSAAFGVNKNISVEKNHMMMGLVVNKLLLAYKNKKGFLEELVMTSKPSLISMYNVIKKLAKKNGYKTPMEVGQGMSKYVDDQIANGKPEFTLPKNMKGGQHSMWGTTIVKVDAQTGGWRKITYDRYTPFKVHPDAEYIVMGWTMGLIQVSKNPFKSGKNPIHLADMAWKVMKKWESRLKATKITLVDMKYKFEQGHTPDSMGFRYEDLVALFDKNQVKGIELDKEDGSWNQFIKKLLETPIKRLSYKQKNILDKVSINAWDLMQTISGGHKDITNIQGFNFLPKDVARKTFDAVMGSLAYEMKDKKLK